jgi:hypothetical protein
MQFSFFKLNLSFKNEFFYNEKNKINSLVNKSLDIKKDSVNEIINAVVEPAVPERSRRVETTTTETELLRAQTDSETSSE